MNLIKYSVEMLGVDPLQIITFLVTGIVPKTQQMPMFAKFNKVKNNSLRKL